MNEVICDWIDVTYSPEDSTLDDVSLFLDSQGFHVSHRSDEDSKFQSEVWRSTNNGTLRLSRDFKCHRVSCSGRVLESLRSRDLLDVFYTLLSGAPYQVTRLDCALDIDEDGATHVASMLCRYPESCRLTRKAVRTNWIMQTRADGIQSGTFYVGNRRSGGVTARVYDKQLQLLDVHGEYIPPRVRYEVTVKKTLPITLRDASQPTTLFWHLASPSLLSRPPSVHNWEPSSPDDLGWTCPMPEILPFETLQRRVESSPDVERLIELSDTLGPSGRLQLLRLLEKRLNATPTSSSHDQPEVTPGPRAA